MAKLWTIYVTLWTTESDDVERKVRLRNTTNKRRRHGYESWTSSMGGGVRGRKASWQLGMFEDTKIATFRCDEARRLPRAVRRTRGHRPKMIYCLRRSCESCLHDHVRGRATVASEKDVVDCWACRHRTGNGSRSMVVCIGGAVDWCILFGWTCAAVYGLVYFSMNFDLRLSAIWHILVRTGNKAVKSWDVNSCRHIAN